MHSPFLNDVTRRRFLLAAGAAGVPALAAGNSRAVSIVSNPGDAVAAAAPAQWARKELAQRLAARGVTVRSAASVAAAPSGDLCILISRSAGAPADDILKRAGVRIPAVPEALGVVPGKASRKPVLLVCGHDAAGLVYALLDLADRVENAARPLDALDIQRPIVERPANVVRGVARLFTSDIEDKGWYNDREMWPHYLTMLATQRFNRFQLSLGIGYDFLTNVTDGYFLFAYPFLLPVAGYTVRVPQLPDAERDSNLAMLKFISEQTVARGMQFQMGIWMHGYRWLRSPNPNFTIEGLTPETHGAYCRDAVRTLLRACPAISGVTFRVHGESGVEEGSYDFWKTVFSGVATCGRKVEIDMHAKGMDQTMLDNAVGSGMPVKVSPKYWGEHMGLPYHQAEIREVERPRPGQTATGLMKLSAGSRSFLRYGYGDLLREDRRWGVLHRIWPGTQRLLIWGDPVTAAAHSRAFSFCGSDGVEIMEPLSFKGRRGSGIAGGRCAYADKTLSPRWDWEKYVYGHRVWGRLLYNPNSDADVWRRYMAKEFGAGAADLETALAQSSRILPLITTAHAPSAGNNTYWPEVYLNHSMIDGDHPGPYTDSPAPKVFGNVSPFDPQLFSRINDYADELLAGKASGKYSPIEVAQWLEDLAAAASRSAAKGEELAAGKERVEYRRLSIDLALQIGLGRFFAAKFRSGVLYRIHERTGDRGALDACLKMYRAARATWADLAERARGVYVSDITVGEIPQLRGHWLDRLPAMDADIAAIARKLEQAKPAAEARVERAIASALGRPRRAIALCRHVPAARFQPGQPLSIDLAVKGRPSSVRLFYRHVNQAERWESADMKPAAKGFQCAIPAEYTNSAYPLEYYFEIVISSGVASLYPGFPADLAGQPYFVVRRGTARVG